MCAFSRLARRASLALRARCGAGFRHGRSTAGSPPGDQHRERQHQQQPPISPHRCYRRPGQRHGEPGSQQLGAERPVTAPPRGHPSSSLIDTSEDPRRLDDRRPCGSLPCRGQPVANTRAAPNNLLRNGANRIRPVPGRHVAGPVPRRRASAGRRRTPMRLYRGAFDCAVSMSHATTAPACSAGRRRTPMRLYRGAFDCAVSMSHATTAPACKANPIKPKTTAPTAATGTGNPGATPVQATRCKHGYPRRCNDAVPPTKSMESIRPWCSASPVAGPGDGRRGGGSTTEPARRRPDRRPPARGALQWPAAARPTVRGPAPAPPI